MLVCACEAAPINRSGTHAKCDFPLLTAKRAVGSAMGHEGFGSPGKVPIVGYGTTMTVLQARKPILRRFDW